ncbi:RNA-directed DNA polymerase, eukaryota, reverse transcriptase zinc-binding domain protein [Tanacetum coccineum]
MSWRTEKSDDPFDIYGMLNKENNKELPKGSVSSSSQTHPPGFTPKAEDPIPENIDNQSPSVQAANQVDGSSLNKSDCTSGHFKISQIPRTGGSILHCMEELVKVGQTMGYNMEGCENDIMKIIESQGADEFMLLTKGKKNVQFGSICILLFTIGRGVYHDGRFNKVRKPIRQVWIVFIATQDAEEVEGFRSFVEDTWHSAPRDGNNNMLNLMKKLRFLKSKIREWNKSYIQSKKAELIHLQAQLYSFDSEIDKGNNTDDIITRRLIVGVPYSIIGNRQIELEESEFWKLSADDCHSSSEVLPPSVWGVCIPGCSLYKIVTKILANRLVPVLGDIVQEVQSAFVPGRQIMDGPFVLNEIMQWCSYRKKRSIIFKVDFEKAYDSVRFFHGHEQGKNKATWIKWEAVTSGKDQGGLGVASLYALNRALICKWVWKFFTNRESLWTRVIKAIHGEDGSIDKNNDKWYMSTWSHIISEIRLLKEKGIDFFEFLKLKIGVGSQNLILE